MPSPDFLGHQANVGEEEVFGLIHNVKSVPEIRPDRFAGRVAVWADERRQRGDIVRPVITYVQDSHHVSWVRHEGRDSNGNEFCTHHVVCDCAAGIVDEGSPVEIVDRAADCGPALRALQRRAAYVDYTYHTTQILDTLRDTNTGDFEQSNDFHNFAVKTVAYLLELDAKHPKEWPGNLINGEHRVSILATLLQLHPEVVKWYGRLLEESGVVINFDGEVLKLSPTALVA